MACSRGLRVNGSFNSIKVRLRRWSSGRSGTSSGFQFHKGSIKTPPAARCTSVSTCFNSIKVRLRRRMMAADEAVDAFQFHKGSIKTDERDGETIF